MGCVKRIPGGRSDDGGCCERIPRGRSEEGVFYTNSQGLLGEGVRKTGEAWHLGPWHPSNLQQGLGIPPTASGLVIAHRKLLIAQNNF